MNFKKYLYPKSIIRSLTTAINELNYYKKYKSIIIELEQEEKLKKIGFKRVGDKLYYGVNLNPELLMYTEDSQESVELKFVSEASKKYTDFLQKEGILDSIMAKYERVYNEDFYGYIVEINYAFRTYNKNKLIYDVLYCILLPLISIASIYMLAVKFL